MSKLTKERLEEIASGQNTVSIPEAAVLARELLSLRTAGDNEVDKLFVNAMHAIGVDESVNPEGCKSSQRSLEELHHLAITRGQTRTEAVNKAAELAKECERLQEQLREAREVAAMVKLTGHTYGVGDPTDVDPEWPIDPEAVRVLETGEYLLPDECAVKMNRAACELRDAQSEIERLKEQVDSRVPSLVAKISTLTAERDEARSELEDAQRQEIETIAAVINHRKLIDEQKQKIDFLTAELAALKSAPGMAEVDAAKRGCVDLLAQIVLSRGIEEEAKPPQPYPVPSYQELRERIDALADIARRSIASRYEVVGLLKWLDEFWDFKEVKRCLCEYASDKVYGGDQQKARRILEIVEGK